MKISFKSKSIVEYIHSADSDLRSKVATWRKFKLMSGNMTWNVRLRVTAKFKD